MADIKISALPQVTSLGSSDVLPAVYSGTTSKITFANLSAAIVQVTSSISASYAATASYVANALTASYVDTAQSASYVLQAVSSSHATSASYISGSVLDSTNPALSASYALTASYALNGGSGDPFPYTGSVKISGSLSVEGELSKNTISGQGAAAIGGGNTVSANQAFAHGGSNTAGGASSHAQGVTTQATAAGAHSEGLSTVASGQYSHAEGTFTLAASNAAHAEGRYTTASSAYSHAEGYYTVTAGNYQHVQGQFNISSSAQSAFIIGNGTGDSARRNLVFASGSDFQVTGSLLITGSATIYDMLVIVSQSVLPATAPSGAIMTSGSGVDFKPYFWNGSTWASLI